MESHKTVKFKIEELPSNTLKISFCGSLDIDCIANIWDPCVEAELKYLPNKLILDLKEVVYCDVVGMVLIKTLEKNQLNRNKICVVDNLSENFKSLLNSIEQKKNEIYQDRLRKENFPEHIGHITVNYLRTFRENIVFLGALCCQIFFVVFGVKKIRWRDVFRIAEETGPGGLPIIALIGFLIGLISTFQAAPSFKQFGVQIYMVNLVGLGLVREMGPLLTSVLLAGRTASSFAAELGTMRINQEIDALNTMGIDTIRFLVVPRILTVMVITPILEIFFIIFGLLGCLVVMSFLGYTLDAVVRQLYQAISVTAYIGGLIKVFAFGIVIAGVGCLHGIKTRFGAQAVGYSTTQAVVNSLIMLIIIDGVFALIYYVLGI